MQGLRPLWGRETVAAAVDLCATGAVYQFASAAPIWGRLRADPDRKVSAALNLLHVPIPADGEPEHYKVVLHYVTQAADIAENGIDELKWLAVNYQRKAALWRELADLEEQATTYVTATAGRMLVPDHMRIISEQCKAKGEQFMANPARLGMNRKTGAGDPMLAVRRLAGEIRRWNRGMMRHGSPGAIKLLIEAAMGCEIPETTVRRGIRANG